MPPSGRLSPGLITVPFYETWNLKLVEGTTTFTILNFISRMNILNGLLASDFMLVKDALIHLILPAMALGTIPMALIARMSRSAMLEVLGQDYIRTARAKGLRGPRILFRHAFPNAAKPLIALLGVQLPFLFSGALVAETIFAWPGMGRLFVDALTMKENPVLMGMIVSGFRCQVPCI